MKLRICSAFAATFLFLTGCTVSGYEFPNEKTNTNTQNVSINLVLKEGQALFIEEAARQYSSNNPNISIQVIRLEDSESYHERLVFQIHSGEIPTAFSVDGQYDLTYWKGDIQPLSQEWLDIAPAILLEPVTSGRRILAFPLEMSAIGVVYNKNLLDTMEIDHSRIGSLDGLREVTGQIQEQIVQSSLTTVVCQNGDYADLLVSSSLDKSQPETLAVTDELASVMSLSGKNEKGMDDAVMMANQKAAIYVGDSGILRDISIINPDIAQSLRMAPLEINGGQKYLINGIYLAVYQYADSAQKDALAEFLNWIYFSSEGLLEEYQIMSPYGNTASTQIESAIYSACRTEKAVITKGVYAPSGWRQVLNSKAAEFCSKSISWDEFSGEVSAQWSKLYRI